MLTRRRLLTASSCASLIMLPLRPHRMIQAHRKDLHQYWIKVSGRRLPYDEQWWMSAIDRMTSELERQGVKRPNGQRGLRNLADSTLHVALDGQYQ